MSDAIPERGDAASVLFEDEYSFNPVEGLQYHVARDGRFLMIGSGAGPRDDTRTYDHLVVVENWLDELTRMAPGS